MCVQENGSIGLLYEALPNNCLCYTQFNLDWLLENEDKSAGLFYNGF